MLTGKLIDELTMYYGFAIRRNCVSVGKIKKEIWTTLYHKIFIDKNPQHQECPVGDNSWQKAKTLNEFTEYKHKHLKKKFSLLSSQFMKILVRMTVDSLLRRFHSEQQRMFECNRVGNSVKNTF